MKKILLITAFTFSCLQVQASEELTSGQACELGLNPTNTESEESTVNNTEENSTLNDNAVTQLNDETVTQFNEELSTRLQKLNSMNYPMNCLSFLKQIPNYPMNCLSFLKQIPNFLDFLVLLESIVLIPINKCKVFRAYSTLFILSLFFSSAINIGLKKYLSNHITNSSMIEKNIRCLDIAMVASLASFCLSLGFFLKTIFHRHAPRGETSQDLLIPLPCTLVVLRLNKLIMTIFNFGSFVFKSRKLRKQLENKGKYLKNKQGNRNQETIF